MTSALHTTTGRELPTLAWHHMQQEDPLHLQERFRSPYSKGIISKPRGGLWTAVLYQGDLSAFSTWGSSPFFRMRSGPLAPFMTPLRAKEEARFLVIDGMADAVAARRAFAGKPHRPDFGGISDRGLTDFTLLPRSGLAGVYLTRRGVLECADPDAGEADMWGWDVECVWCAVPEVEVAGVTCQWLVAGQLPTRPVDVP